MLLLAFNLIANLMYGQEQWEKEGEIKDLEIEMTKERQLILPRANRYYEKIPARPFEPIVPAITYDVKRFSFASPNYTAVIRPLRLKQEELSKLYGNYVSGGIGNYTSFFVEGSVATKRDKNKLLGADFYWRGFGKGPVDDDHSASSVTRLTLFGKKVTENITTRGDLNYNNNRVYFYGFQPGTDVDREKLKQVYETFSAKASFENSKKGDFNYRVSGGYSYLRDAYLASEGEVSLGLKSDYALKGSSRLTLAVDVFLINRKDSLYSQSRNLVRIQPAYEFLPLENLKITAGFNLALTNDDFPDAGSVHIYPHVTGRYTSNERVTFYAGFSGNMDKVNLHTLSTENPWLNSNNPITHTNRQFELDGGMESSLGNKLTTKFGLSFASLKNLYFYQNIRDGFDPAGQLVGIPFDKFDLAYDNTTGRLNPYGEATYTQSEVFSAAFRFDYFQYTTEAITQPWHRPTYRGDLQMRYNLFDKVLLQAGVVAQGGMKALDPVNGQTVALDPAFDVNLRGRYFFSKQISAFIHLDNLLSNQYPLYLSYPARGFQAMVGASWSF